jgi:hypothetical protein
MIGRFTDDVQAGLAALPLAVTSHMGTLTNSAQVLMNATNTEIATALSPYGAPGAAIAARLETIRNTGIASGISEVFAIGAGLMVVAFVASLFLREIPLRTTNEETAAAGPYTPPPLPTS